MMKTKVLVDFIESILKINDLFKTEQFSSPYDLHEHFAYGGFL